MWAAGVRGAMMREEVIVFLETVLGLEKKCQERWDGSWRGLVRGSWWKVGHSTTTKATEG